MAAVPPAEEPRDGPAAAEDEPLLGGPGDAIQHTEAPLYKNLYLGVGSIAQGGIIMLAVLVWASVLTKPIILFSAHPVRGPLV